MAELEHHLIIRCQINRARSFVQNRKLGVPQHRPGQREQLPFTSGKARPGGTDGLRKGSDHRFALSLCRFVVL